VDAGVKFYIIKNTFRRVHSVLQDSDCVDFLVNINVSEGHTAFIFRVEYAGSMFLRNVGSHLQVHTSAKPRKSQWASSLPREAQISYLYVLL
jgi:hypothetical protein